ncbi:radical SAM/SPASM domain-containing protein [Kordiimonas sp.]|uniref:radical SAM/SPASM domain-containing protein n=1 Tax=Kordiimonas sp. TaxID=1970157 RepID=UPI003B525178
MNVTEQYGFYDRLSGLFPSQINVDVTEVCNLACVHCPHPEFKKGNVYTGRMLEPELNARMVDEVREHGQGITGYIRYTAEGEPMAHKHIFEMLKYAVDRSETTVSITTNGTLLDDGRLHRLLDTGLHVIDISVDAFEDETYERIRVGGKLDKVRSNILALLAAAKKRVIPPKIVVSYVEQPFNVDETDRFEKYWKAQGVDFVVIRRLHSCAGFQEERVHEMAEASQSPRRPCLYPWERIVLNPRGFLSFCPADWTKGATITDYRQTTIKEVWSGEYMRSLRQAHIDNDFTKHSLCGGCPDWEATRWPEQGRSYANMIQEFKDTE